MNGNFRNFAIWIVILVMLLALFQVFNTSSQSASAGTKTYSEFISDVDAGNVQSVVISDKVLRGTYGNGGTFDTEANSNSSRLRRWKAGAKVP